MPSPDALPLFVAGFASEPMEEYQLACMQFGNSNRHALQQPVTELPYGVRRESSEVAMQRSLSLA